MKTDADKGVESSPEDDAVVLVLESEEDFIQGTLDVQQLEQRGEVVVEKNVESLQGDQWKKPAHDEKVKTVKKVEFAEQNAVEALFFAPEALLNEEEASRYEGLQSSELVSYNDAEREEIVAVRNENIVVSEKNQLVVELKKDLKQGVAYQAAGGDVKLLPQTTDRYDAEVLLGMVNYVNEDNANEILSYYFDETTNTQKEWILLKNRPAQPYVYRWELDNADQ